jgi:metallo-beta-lactamase class B
MFKMKNHIKILLAFIVNFTAKSLEVAAQKQISHSQLAGQYDLGGGMVIQFSEKKGKLFLITPGNPLQEMQMKGNNTYVSTTLQNDQFTFELHTEDSIRLLIKNAQGTMTANKVSNDVMDYTDRMDSVLTQKKRINHFEFWYSDIDKANIDSLSFHLESKYEKILKDLKLTGLPITRVKIYPDLESFHYAINQPDAPAEVLATAFGKDEFRMVSPTKGGDELMQFIAHEFTHCVHLNIDYAPNNPRWLWEGLAMYESGWIMDPTQIDAVKNKQFPALESLGNGMEYMLGYVIIEAIKDLWGSDALISLIKNRGNTEKAVGLNQKDFEAKVFDRIYRKYIDQGKTQTVIPPPVTNPSWSKDVEPFRIAGNLYYVGTEDLACYLVTSSQGHILVNTGLAESASMIRSHVEKLGFKFSDIKILTTTQAHYDHVGAMGEIKKETNAKFMVNEKDAQAMSDGGNSDFFMGGKGALFLPVQADRLLHDGDVISLGNINMTMLHHPGHTKGSCSFMLDVKDDRRSWRVLIANMPSVVGELKQPGNAGYPEIAEDFKNTFKKMKDLKFDIWLASHASQCTLHAKQKKSSGYHPQSFAGRKDYDETLVNLKNDFEKKLRASGLVKMK